MGPPWMQVERKLLARDWPQRLQLVQARAAELPSPGAHRGGAPGTSAGPWGIA